MKIFKRSLRNRFFFSLITLVFGASILIAGVTIYQYQDEAKKYQKDKLERKVTSIKASINYQIENTTYPVDTEHVPLIFKDKIYELSHIHNTKINIYDLNGQLLKSSKATFFRDADSTRMAEKVLDHMKNSAENSCVTEHVGENGKKFQSSYTYITDNYFKPIAILNLPHIENDGFMEKELRDFLSILGQVYLLLIIAAIILSYFLSKYITKSLNRVSEKIYATRVDQKNQKILIKNVPQEITGLIKAYNAMVDELEESAVKLATSEREQAWREMAKQVAHEIKNPLTPMRLSIQSFERKFESSNPENEEKVKDFSKSLIQQIDTMSAIASAFSDFAKMPKQQNELLNVPQVVKLSLEIFNEDYISFTAENDELMAYFDRTQLIRVVTNLVKNAMQATEHLETPKIEVFVGVEGEKACIKIKDNGTGISDENKNRIFEPKFTTKSSGMGLGLGIIKKIIETYNGEIYFESIKNNGTTFTVKFPKTT